MCVAKGASRKCGDSDFTASGKSPSAGLTEDIRELGTTAQIPTALTTVPGQETGQP